MLLRPSALLTRGPLCDSLKLQRASRFAFAQAKASATNSIAALHKLHRTSSTSRPPARPVTAMASGAEATATPQDGGSSASTERPPEWAAHDQRWEQQFWAPGLKPGERFDGKGPSPALLDLLDYGRLDVAGKRVFVPGCGRGYDVVEFAQRGAAEVVGLELAPTAAQVASDYVSGQLAGTNKPRRARVVQGNYFEWQDPSGPYDAMYDYTFLCALMPEMRQGWAKAAAAHVKPGGLLVTLMFPVEPPRSGGPPFQVSVELYHSLLEPAGFDPVLIEPVPDSRSHPGRGGKEHMGVWRRRQD